MKRLIDREWLRKRKNIIIRSLLLLLVPVVTISAYKIVPSFFQEVRNTIVEMPDILKSLLGLGIFDRRSDLAVFLIFISTVIGIANIIFHSMEASDDLVIEERMGTIGFLCGRLCSRKELYLGKAAFSILGGLSGQFSWCLILCVTAVIGASIPGQKLDSVRLVGEFTLYYLTAFLLSGSLSFMLGVIRNRTAYSNHWESVGIAIFVFGFLANPMRDYHFIYKVGYISLSLIFSIIALIIGMEEYLKRNL